MCSLVMYCTLGSRGDRVCGAVSIRKLCGEWMSEIGGMVVWFGWGIFVQLWEVVVTQKFDRDSIRKKTRSEMYTENSIEKSIRKKN